MPTPPRVPRELATRILDRAADIEASADVTDLASLRAAALDAGISEEAFERALLEVASSRAPAERAEAPPTNAYEVAAKAAAFGIGGGTAAILLTSLVAGGAPPTDAVIGAVVTGGGMLVGVIAYLLGRLR